MHVFDKIVQLLHSLIDIISVANIHNNNNLGLTTQFLFYFNDPLKENRFFTVFTATRIKRHKLNLQQAAECESSEMKWQRTLLISVVVVVLLRNSISMCNIITQIQQRCIIIIIINIMCITNKVIIPVRLTETMRLH